MLNDHNKVLYFQKFFFFFFFLQILILSFLLIIILFLIFYLNFRKIFYYRNKINIKKIIRYIVTVIKI